jgi:hypothetical protein
MESLMSKKTKTPVFTVWVKRDHFFTAEIKADSLADALGKVKEMDIDQLLDAPGETMDSEHKITGVFA